MPERPLLDALDQRILGSLLEKQRTVPASYPLSLTALHRLQLATSRRARHRPQRGRACRAPATSRRAVCSWCGRARARSPEVPPTHRDARSRWRGCGPARPPSALLRGEQTVGEFMSAPSACSAPSSSPTVRSSRRPCGALPPARCLCGELDRRPGGRTTAGFTCWPPRRRRPWPRARPTQRRCWPTAPPHATPACSPPGRSPSTSRPTPRSPIPSEEWPRRVPAGSGYGSQRPVAHLGRGGDLTARLASDGAAVVGFDDCPGTAGRRRRGAPRGRVPARVAGAVHAAAHRRRLGCHRGLVQPHPLGALGAARCVRDPAAHAAPRRLALIGLRARASTPASWGSTLFCTTPARDGRRGVRRSQDRRVVHPGGDGATPERLYLIIGCDADA